MKENNIRITACNHSLPEHKQAIINLIDAYIKDEMGEGIPLSENEQEALAEGLRTHPRAIVRFAESDGNFIGIVVAYEHFSTFTAKPMINIHDVFVLKAYRGRGVGRKLMEAIIHDAEIRGCSRISLEVRQDNIKAQKLYRSVGFDETEPPMYYWRKYL